MDNCCVVRPEELEEPSRNSILILQMNVESCLLMSRQLCQQGRSEAEAEVHVAGLESMDAAVKEQEWEWWGWWLLNPSPPRETRFSL